MRTEAEVEAMGMTEGPYCECGYCDAIGRESGEPVRLPMDAWRVAGSGDLERLAVLPDHAWHFDGRYPAEAFEGWVAVGPDPVGFQGPS